MRKFTLLLAGAGSGSHHFARAARSSHFAGRTALLQRTLNLAAEDRSAKQGTVSLWGEFLELRDRKGSFIPQIRGEDRPLRLKFHLESAWRSPALVFVPQASAAKRV